MGHREGVNNDPAGIRDDRAFLASLREQPVRSLRAQLARLWREDESPHRWQTAATKRALSRRGRKP